MSLRPEMNCDVELELLDIPLYAVEALTLRVLKEVADHGYEKTTPATATISFGVFGSADREKLWALLDTFQRLDIPFGWKESKPFESGKPRDEVAAPLEVVQAAN